MTLLYRRQAFLIAVSVVAMIVATGASGLLRGVLVPVAWGPPFYINPLYTVTFLFYGALGVFTVFRADDHAWPWYVGGLGVWVFIVAFEDSILQWFVFQLGIATIGGRVNPVGITASLAAMSAAILMHVGQLGRRLRDGFSDRGLDPREVAHVEAQSWRLGLQTVLRALTLAAIGSVILWVAQFPLGRARVGIGALGILGGLLIVSIIAVMAFRLLGPSVPGTYEEQEIRATQRRPPRGFR